MRALPSQCEQEVGKVWTSVQGVDFVRKCGTAGVYPEESQVTAGHSAHLAATRPVSPLSVLLYSDGFPLVRSSS